MTKVPSRWRPRRLWTPWRRSNWPAATTSSPWANGRRWAGTSPTSGGTARFCGRSRAPRPRPNTRRTGSQLWAWLNPLLLIGSYFVVFGLIIQTTGTIHNKIGFLAIGVVLFQVIASVVNTGSKSIVSNMNLMRALHFPRAILPLSVALTEFLANIPAFIVLFLVMIITGERPSVEWLLFPVSILMLVMMLTGMALIGARIINISRDLGNLIPVSLRLLRYVSGVFFPIAEKSHGLAQIVLMYQPFALPLQTARESLMYDPAHAVHWPHWAAQAGWSIGFLLVGIVVFWVDEARYGRG